MFNNTESLAHMFVDTPGVTWPPMMISSFALIGLYEAT